MLLWKDNVAGFSFFHRRFENSKAKNNFVQGRILYVDISIYFTNCWKDSSSCTYYVKISRILVSQILCLLDIRNFYKALIWPARKNCFPISSISIKKNISNSYFVLQHQSEMSNAVLLLTRIKFVLLDEVFNFTTILMTIRSLRPWSGCSWLHF